VPARRIDRSGSATHAGSSQSSRHGGVNFRSPDQCARRMPQAPEPAPASPSGPTGRGIVTDRDWAAPGRHLSGLNGRRHPAAMPWRMGCRTGECEGGLVSVLAARATPAGWAPCQPGTLFMSGGTFGEQVTFITMTPFSEQYLGLLRILHPHRAAPELPQQVRLFKRNFARRATLHRRIGSEGRSLPST